MKKLIYILLLLSSLIADDSKTLVFTENTKIIEHFSMQFLRDETGKLSIQEIQNIEFKDFLPSQFTLGYVDGNDWFKFSIKNSTKNKQFILYFTEPFWDEVNLYKKENNEWEKYENGLFTALENREIQETNPSFLLNIQANETKTYYVQASSAFSHVGEFKIYTHNAYLSQDKNMLLALYMFYFGGLLIVILTNSFFIITLREKVYTYYVGYITLFAGFVFIFSGADIYLGLGKYHHDLLCYRNSAYQD